MVLLYIKDKPGYMSHDCGTAVYDLDVACCAQAFKLVVTDRSQLDGLSNTTLLVAALNAQEAGHANATRDHGPWILQLGDSTYAAVISFAHDRGLREKMYKAYTR